MIKHYCFQLYTTLFQIPQIALAKSKPFYYDWQANFHFTPFKREYCAQGALAATWSGSSAG
jgi:hypothetical protein